MRPHGAETSTPHAGFDEGALVGLDVTEAARLANAAGWLVRAYETEAVLAAGFRLDRLN
jgi:hypothetical protein